MYFMILLSLSFILGCYDGSVYILDRFCGAIVWTVATGGAVKSSPTVDSVTGFVYVGSHDHHVYALAVQVRKK